MPHQLKYPTVSAPGLPIENVFHVLDDAGLKCGNASVVEFINETLVPERPLNFYVTINALTERAFDMLMGAALARAIERSRQQPNLPARIYVPCHPGDADRIRSLVELGFQNDDAEVRMRKMVSEGNSDANPPVGCFIAPVILENAGDVKGLLLRLNKYSLTNHDDAWITRMQEEPFFVVYGAWQDQTLLGELVMTAYGAEAHIEMFYTRPEFRRRGVATSLLAHAGRALLENNVRLVYTEAWERNRNAMSVLRRNGFDVIEPITLYPGIDL